MDQQILPPNAPYLFKLPDELLVSIIEYAAYDTGFRISNRIVPVMDTTFYNKDCLKTLSLVCHGMKRIAQPLLYRTISFKYPNSMVPPTKPVVKLHRTLKEKPELRQHCRSLHMYVPDQNKTGELAAYTVALDFSKWLTTTKHVLIHGGFDVNSASAVSGDASKRTWGLIRQIVANLQDLEHVRIERHGYGLDLTKLLQSLTLRKVRKLEISGAQGTAELGIETRRTASFTSLDLKDSSLSPASTSLLLQWPTTLTRFSFGRVYNNAHQFEYPLLERMLLVHSATLTHITLSHFPKNSCPLLFNATLFPKLEFFQLSAWQMHRPVQFSVDDANILGPSVETYCWDFIAAHGDEQAEFGESEAAWVAELARTASIRGAALKTVRIMYALEHRTSTARNEEYAWDLMDDVRDRVMRPMGMDLVYNKPNVSKDEWLEARERRIAGDGWLAGRE